jgi:hypothetical protein
MDSNRLNSRSCPIKQFQKSNLQVTPGYIGSFSLRYCSYKKNYTTKNLLVEQFKGKEEQLPLFIKEKIN